MERPKGVPEQATYDAAQQQWTAGSAQSGTLNKWHKSGRKAEELRYKNGELNGPFRRFHATGESACEGNYKNGELHGVCTYSRGKDGAGPLPQEDIDESIFSTEIEYHQGRTLITRYYNKDKQRVLGDGTLVPDSPKGVPSVADFDAASGRWTHGSSTKTGERNGYWMAWSQDGTLVEEVEYRAGLKDGANKIYADNGTLVEEGTYAEGKKTGTWSTYDAKDGRVLTKADYDDDEYHGSVIEYGPDGRSKIRIEYENGMKSGQFLARIGKEKYKGGKIRVENGTFKDDQPVGRWKLLDKKLNPLFTVDFGHPQTDEKEMRAADVMSDAVRGASAWSEHARTLFEERHIGEAILAAARGFARAKDKSGLIDLLKEHTAPLSDTGATALSASVLNDEGNRYCSLSNALVRGARPESILQQVAKNLDREGKSHAALDFIDAAVLIAPKTSSLHFTRALIAINLGDQRAAAAGAEILARDDEKNGTFLKDYTRVLFPTFDFWPERLLIDGVSVEGGGTIAQDRPAVAHVIQEYATRFERARRAIMRRIDAVYAWLPPDVSPLLPMGDVDFYSGDDAFAALDVDDATLVVLLCEARALWAALCWICYATGADRLTLPLEVVPSPDAHTLFQTTKTRLAALIARSNGAKPGARFVWEGVSLGAMNDPIVDVALREHEEVFAALRWLFDGDVPSPFTHTARTLSPDA